MTAAWTDVLRVLFVALAGAVGVGLVAAYAMRLVERWEDRPRG